MAEQQPEWRTRWSARWRHSILGRVLSGYAEVELMRRAMAFATLGLVTLIPLLILVAAVDPFSPRGFGQWIADGMGLPASAAAPLVRVFRTPHGIAKQTGALSLTLLVVFGLTFVAEVQIGYEQIWRLPARSLLRFWHRSWRLVVWLAALTGYASFEVASGRLLAHGAFASAVRIFIFVTAGLLFFWWGQYFLLAGRVQWSLLLPGAIATVAGLSGLRAFSSLVFDPMIASGAEADGAVGVVLVVVSWLIGVGFVIYGGSLAGRCYYEHRAARAEATVTVTVPPAAASSSPGDR